MFERFTERARQVVVLSQAAARELDRDHIRTEHLLLGLIREEEGLASRVLASLDVTAEKILAAAEHVEKADDEHADMRGQIPFTPATKKVLEESLREALSLGHNYIGTEHILLALLRDPAAVAVLAEHDASDDKIRSEIHRALTGPGMRKRATLDTERLTRVAGREVGRRAYDVYVSALWEQQFAGQPPVAWDFLSEAEQAAWERVGVTQAHTYRLAS